MDTKRCSMCKETKPTSAFYPRPNGRTRSRCIPCCKAEGARTRAQRRPAALAWYHRNKAAVAEQTKARRGKAPHRFKARDAVIISIRKGDMPRAREVPCAEADETCAGDHHWHHDSYLPADWLNVRALCASHHKRWHYNNNPLEPTNA